MSLASDLTQVLTPYAEAIKLSSKKMILRNWQIGKAFLIDDETTSINTETDVVNKSNNACMVVDCVPGEVYALTGSCNSFTRRFAILDANNDIIQKPVSTTSWQKEYRINIPTDAVKLIVNVNINNANGYELFFLKDVRIIQNDDDLNNLKEIGITYMTRFRSFSNDVNIDNLPTKVTSGFLLKNYKPVIQSGDTEYNSLYFIQRLETYGVGDNRFIFERSNTSTGIWGAWVEIFNGTQVPLDVRHLYEIPENTDLDSITQWGTYYCPNATRAATLSNTPDDKQNTGGFALYVLGTNSGNNPTTYRRQVLLKYAMNEPSTYVRQSKNPGTTWGAWRLLVTSHLLKNPVICFEGDCVPPYYGNKTPIKTINIATCNCAHYHYTYEDNAYLNTLPLKIMSWRRWLLKTRLNILFLQEVSDTIDSDKTISAFDTLYAPFFDQDHNIGADTIVTNRRKILNNLGWDTDTTGVIVRSDDTSYTRTGYYNYVLINDSELGDVLLVNIHNFAFDGKEAERLKLLNEVKGIILNTTYEYLIIGGDFNVNSDTDRENLIDFCEDINAFPVNGGIIGWFATSSVETSATYHTFDNLIVSDNIRIDNIECDPYNYLNTDVYTDHCPVVATITFMTDNQS